MIYVLNINCWKHLRLIVACRLLWYFHECIHILYDLLREHTGHSKNTLPTTQEKTLHVDITRWLTPKSGWFYSCSQKWRNSIQSAKIRQGADCGSDHEHLIVKFWLKLKKVGKTTKPFRYDLNQIPYDYTVEVSNRFKGLGLKDSAWRTMEQSSWHCTGGRDQDHPQEKEMQKDKIVVWIGLTNIWEKKRS